MWAGNFSGKNLTNADLRNTKLNYNNLSGTNLSGTKLDGADLTAATMKNATGLPSGWNTAIYNTTTCPDATVAKPATAQTTCVGHNLP